MNCGCSASKATAEPTANSTTKPATPSAAGSQSRNAAAHGRERQHEQAGDQPDGEHRDHLLEAGREQEQVRRRAQPARCRARRRPRPRARPASSSTARGAERARRPAGRGAPPASGQVRRKLAPGTVSPATDGQAEPPASPATARSQGRRRRRSSTYSGDDHGRGQQYEAEPVVVADHDARVVPNALLVGRAVHAPGHGHDARSATPSTAAKAGTASPRPRRVSRRRRAAAATAAAKQRRRQRRRRAAPDGRRRPRRARRRR